MKKGLSFLAVAAFAAAITLTGSIPAFARDSYDAPSGYHSALLNHPVPMNKTLL